MAAGATFGAVYRGGDRRARSWRHDRRLSRLRFGGAPPQDAAGVLIYGYATRLFEQATQALGPLAGLVNNAGVGGRFARSGKAT